MHGKLSVKATKCKYKERNRRLKEGFKKVEIIPAAELIKELTIIKDISKIMSE